MKNFIKKQGKKVLSSSKFLPISNLFSPFYSGIGSIVMLHRVVPNTEELTCKDLEITADYLDKLIQFFLNNNYKIVSLDKMYEILTGKSKTNKKFVVFTFDDGYVDNYTLAYPIFKKYNIPFTIYLTTSFPDKTAILWWYALKDLINNNSMIDFDYLGKHYVFNVTSREQEMDVYLEIRKLILSLNNTEQGTLFKSLFGKNGIDLYGYPKKLTMSWEQIIELSNDNLVTIGAHTINHYNLRKLDSETLRREILESKSKIERITQTEVGHFAFPFGSINEASKREFKIARELGFKTSTTTRCGNIFREHEKHTNCLPRITLSPYNESPFPQYYTDGFISAMRNRFKRVITD